VAFGGGFALGGLGVLLHNLPLLYLGFGVLAGTGIGLSYVPPVATLLRWFPDRRGMATGLTLMGFGGGALVSTPYMTWLIERFRRAPEYLGNVADVQTVKEGGRRFVELGGELREVVVAKASDIAQLNMPDLQEGVFFLLLLSTASC
jgi:MFS family permease